MKFLALLMYLTAACLLGGTIIGLANHLISGGTAAMGCCFALAFAFTGNAILRGTKP